MSKQTVKTKLINGVDVIGLEDTIRAIQGDPELAKFEFRAKNKWIDGGLNRTSLQSYYGCREEMGRDEPFVNDADEPPVLLGEDRGPNPVEYALNALAACMTTSMVYHAASRGIEIESLESELEGDIDLRGFLGLSEDVPRGYQDIRVTFTVKSDAPAEQLKDLAAFSPVFNTIANSAPISVRVKKA